MNIRESILKEYGIDISVKEQDILILYKIKDPDITDSELQSVIEKTRATWAASANSPNEKVSAKANERLKNADVFEKILKDPNLRKKLFEYKNSAKKEKTTNKHSTNTSEYSKEEAIAFAKEYFSLVETTKKLKKRDIDFFFKYYKNIRKYKKSILDMLNSDFKINDMYKESKDDIDEDSDEDDEIIEDDKNKKSSNIIVSLFKESTIINLKKCLDKYDTLSSNDMILNVYPDVKKPLYDFLCLTKIHKIEDFQNSIATLSKEAYSKRMERGDSFIDIVDVMNILVNLSKSKDVIDNIEEFKLLIKYPTLTPYMYSFVDVKKKSISGLADVANEDYYFRNQDDFITNYYSKLRNNFGLTDNSIRALLNKAEKNATKNEVLNKLDEKFGTFKVPFAARFAHALIYWPIFIMYFLFEVVKVIFKNLPKAILPLAIFVLIFEEIYPWFGEKDMIPLAKLLLVFSHTRWLELIQYMYDLDYAVSGFAYFMYTILFFLEQMFFHGIIPFAFYFIVKEFSEGMVKRFDWDGYERTLKKIMQNIKNKTEEDYRNKQKPFRPENIFKILFNILCTIALVAGALLIKTLI